MYTVQVAVQIKDMMNGLTSHMKSMVIYLTAEKVDIDGLLAVGKRLVNIKSMDLDE